MQIHINIYNRIKRIIKKIDENVERNNYMYKVVAVGLSPTLDNIKFGLETYNMCIKCT